MTVIIVIYTMIVAVIRNCILVSVCSREVFLGQVDLKAFLVNWESFVQMLKTSLEVKTQD